MNGTPYRSPQPRGPEPNREGEVLGSKYMLLRKLGVGGMGAVYEAKHVLVGSHLAVKLLHHSLAHNEEAVARFHREAQAAGSLDCENVVAITDFGVSDDGTPFMVMELLKGETTGDLLRRELQLPVPRAVSLVLQACRALDAAHGQGIVHRDLKPDNLFVTRRFDGAEVVKVLDFGIAKLRSASPAPFSTQAGQMIGTLCYMPAEQVRGDKDIDHRADIYALGAILYEALTGETPHPGNEAHHIIYHILHRPPRPVEELRPQLPPGLAAIVHKALAFDREDRHQSVAELARALAPFGDVLRLSDSPARPSDGSTDLDASAATMYSSDPAPPHPGRPGPATEQGVAATGSRLPTRRISMAAAVVVVLALVAGTIAFLGRPSTKTVVPEGATHPPQRPEEAHLGSSTEVPRRRPAPLAKPSSSSDVSAVRSGASDERPSARPSAHSRSKAQLRRASAVGLRSRTPAGKDAGLKDTGPHPTSVPPQKASAEGPDHRITYERQNPYE